MKIYYLNAFSKYNGISERRGLNYAQWVGRTRILNAQIINV